MSLRFRIGFTAVIFWYAVFWPLFIFWQHPVVFYACLVPILALCAGIAAWTLHAIWTEP